MNLKKWLVIVGSIGVVGAFLLPRWTRHDELAASPHPDSTSPLAEDILFACQGRIEPASDPVDVSASVDGVIQIVLVAEGQVVREGQLLARMVCPDMEANAQSQLAYVESAKQALVRLRRGSRDEERRAATAQTAGARAVLDHAKAQFDRLAGLFRTEDISRQTLESGQRDLDVAEAALHSAEQHEQLVAAPPLVEDVRRLEAEFAAAEARSRSASAALGRCAIESPLHGTVLRLWRKAGESVSTFTPQPIVTIAEIGTRRVRAEVDERDVGKVFVGQKVAVRADGDLDQTGRVSRKALRMGRKSIQSIVPGDKNDRDVLDVWIDMPANRLPIGLRVLVRFSNDAMDISRTGRRVRGGSNER